jgi:GNAT superfamily N-acetyltransferase
MPLRFAKPQDEDAMVSVIAAAFFNEALFGDAIHPRRHEFPDDTKIFWHAKVRASFRDPRSTVIVATTTEDEQEKIVGVAAWKRQGDDEGAKKVMEAWNDPGPDAFPPLLSTNNRALDPARATLLPDSKPFFEHHWAATTNGIPRSINWFLDLCAVHPSYERRGFGNELVKWGLDRAREENVHASVTSSYQSDNFYLKCGFEEHVGNCSEGEGNPLREAKVKGGNILFMWAKDVNST